MKLQHNNEDLLTNIILAQEPVIGDMAWNIAEEVEGIQVDSSKRKTYTNIIDKTKVTESLIKAYENYFGQAARELCNEVLRYYEVNHKDQ